MKVFQDLSRKGTEGRGYFMSYLRIDRKQDSDPADGFSFVDAPPDDPGDQVVDQERHEQ